MLLSRKFPFFLKRLMAGLFFFCFNSAFADQSWSTFQANARHDGFVNAQIQPKNIQEIWSIICDENPFLPLVAADGRVYVLSATNWFSAKRPLMRALDSSTGQLLWSYAIPSGYHSINPPAVANNTLYFQTANYTSDSYLWAVNANSGELVFRSPFLSQWGLYFAPTPFEHEVYVNTGTYGGLGAYHGQSGVHLWFNKLDIYDQWTPAVDQERVYVYMGKSNTDYPSPGLYLFNRLTGHLNKIMMDPNYVHRDWHLQLAPVLGQKGAVVVIAGRLIYFNFNDKKLTWEKSASFNGQPVTQDGEIYAVNAGELMVVTEEEGVYLWDWQSPNGTIKSNLVLTPEFLILGDGMNTYFVNRKTHEVAHKIPYAGDLAVSDGRLYIQTSQVIRAYQLSDSSPI
jgi:outer membrane protein assembly factor BamB